MNMYGIMTEELRPRRFWFHEWRVSRLLCHLNFNPLKYQYIVFETGYIKCCIIQYLYIIRNGESGYSSIKNVIILSNKYLNRCALFHQSIYCHVFRSFICINFVQHCEFGESMVWKPYRCGASSNLISETSCSRCSLLGIFLIKSWSAVFTISSR